MSAPSRPAPTAVAWAVSHGLTDYRRAVSIMEARAQTIAEAQASELVWLLEHPALYTAGTSSKADDLLDGSRFPVHRTGRGGQLTYHGPGQRIAYLMLDVQARHGNNVRAFVKGLEAWIIDALAEIGIAGRIIEGRIGVWVDAPAAGTEAKIAAIGLRIRRGVSLHGVSLNVAPMLEHYAGIVPCGIGDRGVTSVAALGVRAAMKDVDNALKVTFERRFGPVFEAPDPALDPGVVATL